MKTKSLSIFLVALFVVEMNLGAEEDNNENKEGEKFEYEKMNGDFFGFNFSLKTVLVGDINVGKSALIKKICKNTFPEEYSPTVGVEYLPLDFKIVSDKKKPVLKYQIWDSSGQEHYRIIIRNFYKNARVCLLAYDVTDEKSFNDIDVWLKEAKEESSDGIEHFILIGNKIDLEKERKISKENGEKFAKENDMEFVEVSAKTGEGIKELEYILAKIIYKEFKEKNKKKDESDENCCEKICCNC